MHLISRDAGRAYQLFSRIADGDMKYIGDFGDLDSAKAQAEQLELSKN